MKYLTIIIVSLLGGTLFAINADIRTYVFRDVSTSFVEIIYLIPTEKLQKNYKPTTITKAEEHDSSFQYQVKLHLVLKSSDKVVLSEEYMLNSPFLLESKNLLHQFRWKLEPGNYQLESTLSDAFNLIDELTFINTFEIKPIEDKLEISPIQLFRSVKNANSVTSTLYKHGFEYEPLQYQVVDKNQNILYSYSEVYSLESYNKSKYVLKYNLYLKNNDSIFQKIDDWYKTKTKNEPGVILSQKDISDLPSGNYKLSILLFDADKRIVDSSEIIFDRLNPFWDRIIKLQYENQKDKEFFGSMRSDSVDYYLRALNAILPGVEKNEISLLRQRNKMEEKKMYLYYFWKDRFDTLCIERFKRFQKNISFTNKSFPTGFGYGFESDRGIIYLKYGPPTELISENQDSGAFPYEIWKYNRIANGQANVRFLFYNPDLTETNYRLLHSTCRGELANPKWELELYRKVKEEYDGANPVEATRIKSSINRRAREHFEY
ncbi:MAG: GWxTD domain-containing protein [Saprospiraceae bacterium]|nr:GWxTD domain-containing protein [Saprospiraceae bacterium]